MVRDGELLTNAQCAVALVLLGLALASLPLAVRAALRTFPAGDPARRLVIAATVGGAAVRWLVAPLWMVTMYIGYLLTEQSIALSPQSHYGIASQALYHAVFGVLPHDHRVLMWTNSVCGVAAIPLWAAVGARLLGDRRIGAAFGLLLAFTPLFIKNDNSDANQVPALLWIAGGLLLWLDYLESGARESLLPSLALLALAAIGRPEMPVLVPLLVVTVALGSPAPSRLCDPALWAAAAAGALLAVPHLLHVVHAAQSLSDRESLPAMTGGHYAALIPLLWTRNTVLTADLYPIALLPLAAASLYAETPQRLRAVLLVAVTAIVAVALYSFDLCRANMARVHVQGAILVTLLAAAGTVRVWDALGRAPSPRGARVTLLAALVASTIPTAFALWAPTNEQQEERTIRRAVAALGQQSNGREYTLVRFARVDRNRESPGSDFTHHHFPDYLVRPPAGQAILASITDWIAEPDLSKPAFFYLGMRCYAEFRTDGTPPPHGETLQPACARLRERFRLEPLFEEEVINRGDVWLEYYGDSPRLRLGLYRIERR